MVLNDLKNSYNIHLYSFFFQFLLLEMLTAEGKLVIQQRARLTQASVRFLFNLKLFLYIIAEGKYISIIIFKM